MGFFEDAGNAAASAVGYVGDVMESGGSVIADTAEDVVDVVVSAVEGGADAIDQTVGPNWITPIVGGLIGGVLDFGRDLARSVAGIVRDVFDIVGALLKLDLVGAVLAFVDLVGRVVGLVIVVLRFLGLGYLVGGVLRQLFKFDLRSFVELLIRSRFSEPVASNVRRNVGLTGGRSFGYPLPAAHVVMMIDSASFPGLAQLHEDGVIDLYTMSDRSTDWGRLWEVWPRARTEGYAVDDSGTERPITRFAISRFLESKGRQGRLRFYAMSRQAQEEHKRTATRICEQLGVRLDWSGGDSFSWWRSAQRPVVEITTRAELEMATTGSAIEQWLVAKGLKTGGGGTDVCRLVVVGAFRIQGGFFGITVGQSGGVDGTNRPSPPGCVTPMRDDSCCLTVRSSPGIGAGILHRDVWPSEVFRYVLSHEIGHYVGLCHWGHDSIAYNMWSSAYAASRWKNDGRQAVVDWSLLHYYLANEPYFSYQDAQNCWRYLLDQMPGCVTT